MREAQRLEAIARIAASVPYAEAIANLVANPLKPTAASEGWHDTFDGAAMRNDPNALMQGFSDKKLFSSKAFKLGFALRAAGAQHSGAAAAAVRALCPVAPAPWGVS